MFEMAGDELAAAQLKAYQIWDREGRPHGRHDEHWQQALKELGLDQTNDDTRTAIAAQTRDWDASEEDR
jgi:hypothetical protein